MGHVLQNQRGGVHNQYLFTGEQTCIDWHEGIFHELMEMTGVAHDGWAIADPLVAERQQTSIPAENRAVERQIDITTTADR